MTRTTVRLDDRLMRRAKAHARQHDTTVTRLIDQGLRLVLQTRTAAPAPRVRLPVSTATGGTFPGVDLDDSRALLDRLDRPV